MDDEQPASRGSLCTEMARCSFFHYFFFMGMLLISPAPAASDVLAPNMSSCNLPSQLPSAETPFDCCAPSANYPLRLFTPNFSSSSPSLLRVRRSAHSVDQSYAEKLARAYALMRALPSDDPRSFMQQANIHCAYCNEVYNQMNSSQLFQVHGSWLFFPFHRWYLFFHERILAKLLGEDDFAIPFWNYDHPDRAAIPWLFSFHNLTLADSLRDTLHHPPAAAAIDYTWDTDARPREKQLRENLNAMYRSLIRDATSQEDFFGRPYRSGQSTPYRGYGTVEGRPHNSVHRWMGQKTQVGWKDMGSLYAAARDPLFYAHHALIDRLWDVWKSMPGNYDFEHEDYLSAEFAFYNEDAELVRVKVRDALNTSELGYMYEEVENVWMQAVPERRSAGAVTLTGNETMCVDGEPLTEACSIVLQRDAEAAKGAQEEYMELKLELAVNEGNHLDIYINLPSANADTDSGCEEFFDFYTIIPAFLGTSGNVTSGNSTKTYATRDMRERLAALELSEAASLVVTLVPRPLDASSAYLSLLGLSVVLVQDFISIS